MHIALNVSSATELHQQWEAEWIEETAEEPLPENGWAVAR